MMEVDAFNEQVNMDTSEQESYHNTTISSQPKTQTSPYSSSSSPTYKSWSPQSHYNRKHGSHSDTKTSSGDEEKIRSHSHHRYKSKNRFGRRHSYRSRSRSNDRSRRSYSPNERNVRSRRSSHYSRRESKNYRKFKQSKCINHLLQQKSKESQIEKVKLQTGIALPSYYNPKAVNPNKYAEQILKRKLLWGSKQNDNAVKQVEECKPTMITPNKTASIWQSTEFGDQDGKVTAKFKRLMGIKNNEIGIDNQTSQQGQSNEIIKKQEEMFNSMENQYEVARKATHQNRGLGFGFNAFQQQ